MRALRRALYSMALAAALAAFAFTAHAAERAHHGDASPGRSLPTIEKELAARILALTPGRVSQQEVREVLAHAPAPRIVSLQGSLAPITMRPFAEFLIAMGYPRERLRNPRGDDLSYSSFVDSAQLAGTLAWHYEQDGMMPLMIGHSQGGMMAIRVLHELAGAFNAAIPVVDPATGQSTGRTTIRDPLTGSERPVVGLKVPYAAALATGKLPRVLLGQWSMLSKLRQIPDTVAEFTGFSIEWDVIAGTFPGTEPYAAMGSAAVRNVSLPASYSHIALPDAVHLASDPVTRAWIDAYDPASPPETLPGAAGVDTTNLLHAADIWYSVKKHWCLAAQALVVAR